MKKMIRSAQGAQVWQVGNWYVTTNGYRELWSKTLTEALSALHMFELRNMGHKVPVVL